LTDSKTLDWRTLPYSQWKSNSSYQ